MNRRQMFARLLVLVGVVFGMPRCSEAKGKRGKKGGRKLGRKNPREHTAGHTGVVKKLGDSEDTDKRHDDIRARHEAAMAAQRGQ